MFSADLATKRRKLDREKTAARIERELTAGPVTTKQITATVGLSDSLARRRARAVGGVWDAQALRWRI
jgi:hypothetical protein